MKHKQYYILFLLSIIINNTLKAQNIGEIQSIALKTIRTIDNIPVIYQNEAKGGYHQCDTVSWQFIPKERIRQGMFAYNNSDNSTYRYIGNDFDTVDIALHNTEHDWEKVYIIAQYDIARNYTTGSIVIDSNRLYCAIIDINSSDSIDITNDTAWFSINQTPSLAEVLSYNNSADNYKISNLANPQNAQDAATKYYIDSLLLIINNLLTDLQKNINQNTGFTDADGYTYSTVTLGTQTWMAENLRTTKYPEGTDIPFLNNQEFAALEDTVTAEGAGVYGVNSNDVATHVASEYYDKYGVLYTYGAALKACPIGWHLPTTNDIKILKSFLLYNGDSTDAVPLRAINEWNDTVPATDRYGYTALPAGFRKIEDGEGANLYSSTYWFGSYSPTSPVIYGIFNIHDTVFTYENHQYPRSRYGLSIRYIKDE